MFTKRITMYVYILIFLTLLLLQGCTGAVGMQPTPSATPPPNFSGRFLLLGIQNGGITIYELNSPIKQPVPLWGGFPGASLSAVLSFDSHFAFLLDRQVVVDLTNGDSFQLTLGDIDFVVFSPDSRYLVYGTTGEETVVASLYIRDLSAQASNAIYQGDCATYYAEGISRTLCGRIEGIHWIDDNTLTFSAYFGELPRFINRPPYEINANHTVIITTQGRILNEFDVPRLHDGYSSGSTIVVNDIGYAGTCAWVSASEVLTGTPKTHPFAGISKSPFTTFLPCPTLSPDGQYTLFIDIGSWQIQNLSTGEVVKAYPSLTSCDDLAWSPDMSQVACLSGQSLAIISPNNSTQYKLLEKATYNLLAWLP